MKAANTINVPGTYSNIQDAITAASDGDTISVASGTYAGPITINKQISIVGQSGATIDGRGISYVVRITSPNALISGFTLKNCRTTGVLISSCSGVTIEKNTFERCPVAGIEDIDGSGAIIRDNTLNNLAGYGIYVHATGSTRVSGVTITTNTICNVQTNGIYLEHCTGTAIEQNSVKNNQENGIKAACCDHIIIVNNDIEQNPSPGIYATEDFSDSIIRDNDIIGNNNGILLEFATESVVRNNLLQGNIGYGLEVSESSNNQVYYNTFDQNIENQAVVMGLQPNIFDDGAGRGNYWSDYQSQNPSAQPMDGTGIGDTPYKLNGIDADFYDRYPVMDQTLFVLPEFALGGALLALAACFVAFGLYKRSNPIHLR